MSEFKVGDRVRFRDIPDNIMARDGYVPGRLGRVTEIDGILLSLEMEDGGPCEAARSYRLEHYAPEDQVLVGPKPKHTPVYPTPWTMDKHLTVVDADGCSVLDVYNKALGELIIELVHGYVAPGYQYFVQGMDEVHPDVFEQTYDVVDGA